MLKSARRSAGLTQKEVAEKIKVTQSYISKLEKKVEPLTVETAIKLAKVYSVSPRALL